MADSSARPGPATPGAARSVVAGAFALLDALHAQGGEARLTTLALRTGLPNATAHRLLNQLIAVGAVQRRASTYALGPRLHELGHAWEPEPGLRARSRGPLRRLAGAGLSAVLGSLRGERLLVLEQADGPTPGTLLDPRQHADALIAGVASRDSVAARHEPTAHHHCVAATVAVPQHPDRVAIALLLPEERGPGPYQPLVARIANRVGHRR